MKPSIFDGDGRNSVWPQNAPQNTNPKSLSKSAAMRLIKEFDEKGVTYHSSSGTLVWVVVTHCIEQDIPYTITGMKLRDNGPISGWSVSRSDNEANI